MGCDAYTILRVSDDGCDADGSVLAETDMSIWIRLCNEWTAGWALMLMGRSALMLMGIVMPADACW